MLLCDEPTGNLDSHAAAAVLGLLSAQHAKGVTVVVVTHDDDVARSAQRMVRVRDGRVLSPAAVV
jgi:putative ABC transport system ATP-binding protein